MLLRCPNTHFAIRKTSTSFSNQVSNQVAAETSFITSSPCHAWSLITLPLTLTSCSVSNTRRQKYFSSPFFMTNWCQKKSFRNRFSSTTCWPPVEWHSVLRFVQSRLHLLLIPHCQVCIKASETPQNTLKMITAVFAETLINLQNSRGLIRKDEVMHSTPAAGT